MNNCTAIFKWSNLAAPRIVVEPPSLQVVEGEPAEFRCEVAGNPPPQIEWVRVHGPMSPEVIIHNEILMFRSTSKYDAAEYKCLAKNNVGLDERSVILHVQGKHSVIKHFLFYRLKSKFHC